MVSSAAETVEEYLSALSPDRREAIEQVRAVVAGSLPEGYAETMQYGMISWVVPLARHPWATCSDDGGSSSPARSSSSGPRWSAA